MQVCRSRRFRDKGAGMVMARCGEARRHVVPQQPKRDRGIDRNLGPNLMVPFYRWEAERDSNGGLRMRRVPALRLVGPRNTLLPIAPVIAAIEAPAFDRLLARH